MVSHFLELAKGFEQQNSELFEWLQDWVQEQYSGWKTSPELQI
jgi:hypothetical protein